MQRCARGTTPSAETSTSAAVTAGVEESTTSTSTVCQPSRPTGHPRSHPVGRAPWAVLRAWATGQPPHGRYQCRLVNRLTIGTAAVTDGNVSPPHTAVSDMPVRHKYD
ncbi:hypothetical protein GCM10027259_17020 [Micromonospora palomenae]